MEENDKGEFPEIKEAITKRKCGQPTGGGWKRKLQQASGFAKRQRGTRRAHTPQPAQPHAPPPTQEQPRPVAPDAPHQPHVSPATSGASQSRGPNISQTTGWTDVICPHCSRVAGQYNRSENPGGRDKATWFMRVKDPGTKKWGDKLPFKCSKKCHLTDGPDKAWIIDYRGCCQNT